jgi:hypothetical protein
MKRGFTLTLELYLKTEMKKKRKKGENLPQSGPDVV